MKSRHIYKEDKLLIADISKMCIQSKINTWAEIILGLQKMNSL